MFWFLRGLRKGVVTTSYPKQRDAWAAQLPTPPAFRSSLLTVELAERLAACCSSGALRREGSDLVLDLGACTACGRCVEVGGEAVVASGEFELATRDRGALVKRIPIGGGA
jgi:formate hydrogenlyase subunit 6/NADH:ubiquinone oxidoreductase subunit I